MAKFPHVYRVERATLERAIGSGDEKLVHELRKRWEPEVKRRASDLGDDASPRQVHLHDAIGELIDGVLTVPEHPAPYGVALELLCRRIGVRVEATDSLASEGPPLARLSALRALGIGHQVLAEGWVSIGFSRYL